MRARRRDHPEAVRAVDRARYRRDKPKRLAAMRSYHEKNPDRVAGYKKAWAERNPEKRRAQNIASGALRRGKLVRGSCARAGSECHGRIEMHHADYEKPLEVTWLCSAHHAAERALD